MIICQNCGVELDENANFCSLCGEPLLNGNGAKLDYLATVKPEKNVMIDYQKLNLKQKRKIFIEITALILFSSIFITSTINLIGNHAITWSRYSITIGSVLFVNITLIWFFHRRLFLLFFLSFLASAVLILLIDVFTGRSGWVTKFGIPLLMAAYIVVLSFILIFRRARQKGLNIIAFALIACGMLCVCIDGIISIYVKNYLYVGWSLTVMVATIFSSSFLLYAHHRLKKVNDLKRFFHI